MIKVKPIDKETIDSWPVSESGLTARSVNACTAAGITTVGILRRTNKDQLGKIKGMGAQSISAIEKFLVTCTEIESGDKSFKDLHDVFLFLLSPVQHDTLALRYKLHTESHKNTTLEAIGRKYNVTRERIRQVEEKTKAILSSRLGQACLSGVYHFFEDFINNNYSVVTEEQVASVQGNPLTAGYNNRNLLHLLCDCNPRITSHNSFFSTVPAGKITHFENIAMELLNSARGPLRLREMLGLFSSSRDAVIAGISKEVIVCVLAHHRDIFSTIDDRYFTGNTAITTVIAEIMKKLPQPAQFRLILHEFNKLMQPASRKGHGFMLDKLSGNPCFRRTSSGCYELTIRA